jgi:hypothetical protein
MKFLIIVLLSFKAFGASCKKLKECVDLSAQLMGEKIIYDKKILPFTFELNRPLEINKENVQETLSLALNVFGLTKIPTNLENTSQLIDARDIKFQTDLPSFPASKKITPAIPETHDPFSVTYKGVKGADMEVIAEKIRPLLSRYGRALPMRDGSIIVIDLGTHMRSILPLLQKQDYPLSSEEKSKMELEKKRRHELELARMKSGGLHEIGPHKHKEQ